MLKPSELSRKFLYKVSVLYGPSGTGKTVLAKCVLDYLFDSNIFTSVYCWAPPYSVQNNNYEMIFGKEACFSDFSGFNPWYDAIADRLSASINHANSVTAKWNTIKRLYSMLPQALKEKISRDLINIVTQKYKIELDMSKPQIIGIAKSVMLPYILKNRDYIKQVHHSQKNEVCASGMCDICTFSGVERVLIFVDDFGGEKDIMAGKFKTCPTKSRHMYMTIVLLSQLYTMVNKDFRSNTQIKAFTAVPALTDMLQNANSCFSANDKNALNTGFVNKKKEEKYAAMIMDESDGGRTVNYIVPPENRYPVFRPRPGETHDLYRPDPIETEQTQPVEAIQL